MSSHRTFPLTSLCPSLPPGIACLSTEHFHIPLYARVYLQVLHVFPQNISLTSLCLTLPQGIECLSTEHFRWPLYARVYLQVLHVFPQNISVDLFMILPPGIACLSTEHFRRPLYAWLSSRYCMSFHRTFPLTSLCLTLPPGIACLSTEHFRWPLYVWLYLQVLHVFPQNISVDLFMPGLCSIVFFNRGQKWWRKLNRNVTSPTLLPNGTYISILVSIKRQF